MVTMKMLLLKATYATDSVDAAVVCRSVRLAYHAEASFNVLYQSPLGNVPGALAGLLLAHLHHALLDMHVQLDHYKVPPH